MRVFPRRSHREAVGDSVTAQAPGKVNVTLQVGPLAPDGYHPLVTVFQAVSLVERVTARVLEPGSGIEVSVEGPQAHAVPRDQRNLAWQAAQVLADHAGRSPDVALHIVKGVPVAGGMAGGSADAAATLLACSSLWSVPLSPEHLYSLAARLGSDVPFCLRGGTAVGTGRGDRLTRLDSDAGGHWARWVFGTQAQGLSTPEVFAEFDRLARSGAGTGAETDTGPGLDAEAGAGQGDAGKPGAGMSDAGGPAGLETADVVVAAVASATVRADVKALGAVLSNDLQQAALSLRPQLAQVLAVARAAGAAGVTVCGSGPTVAALAATDAQAGLIAQAWRDAGVVDATWLATGPALGAHVLTGV